MAGNDSSLSSLYKHRWSIAVIFIVLLIMAAVAYFVSPLIDGIVFGIFFAYVTRPIKDFLARHTRFAPLIATFCIMLPVIIIFLFTIIEIKNQIDWLSLDGHDFTTQVNTALASLNVPSDVISQIDNVLANLTDYVIAFAKTIPVGATFTGILLFGTNALVSIFVCFYLLKDGDKIVRTLGDLTPAKFKPAMDFFSTEADRLLSGIYIGTFYTALFIAAMSAIIFFIFGIPHIVLLTAFVFLAAMVPILSGMMVFLPLTAYLYIDRGPATAAIFLLVSLVFIYVPPDFILRPYLINRTSNLHPLLIILSFIGGGLVGGLSGFFAAPLVFGLLVAVYRTYIKYGEKEGEGTTGVPVGPHHDS
jgi:predicted PurR-regulated permease PerM